MIPADVTSENLIFAPVGIAHLTTSNADLIRAAASGKSTLRITTAAQLNGVPHIGTVVTVMTVFAIAEHAQNKLGLPASIVFDALENAPAEKITIDGVDYTRTVGDLIDTGRLDPAERTAGFHQLLRWAADRSGIPYEFRPYAAYQALPAVRSGLHRIASRLDDFRPIVAPADGIVRIRPRCPQCRLMDKAAHHLTITADDHAVHLNSRCPEHGRYRETITIDGDTGWYDANTPVRSALKGYLLHTERAEHDACSVSIDGSDWGGAWFAHVLAPALATLGAPPAEWPVSLFTPLILDRSGGKLSKTLYVRYGSDYADLPAAMLDLNALLNDYGTAALDALWHEVRRWAAEPARLHRSYTADHLARLLPDHAIHRAAA